MHVLQWIAIKDESKEDAHAHIRNNLEEYMGSEYASGMWYDWFVVGGGRWNPNADQYNQTDYSMVMDVNEVGNDVAIEKVKESIQNRIREFKDYRAEFEQSNIDINAKLDTYDGTMDYTFELYPLKKCIDMLQGQWDFNSYYFDMETHSTNPKYFFESLDKGEKNWYLVPVDFHF